MITTTADSASSLLFQYMNSYPRAIHRTKVDEKDGILQTISLIVFLSDKIYAPKQISLNSVHVIQWKIIQGWFR